jgi:hypothetical protein
MAELAEQEGRTEHARLHRARLAELPAEQAESSRCNADRRAELAECRGDPRKLAQYHARNSKVKPASLPPNRPR